MILNKELIPFCGYPIFKISTDDILTKDELAFLKSIPENFDYSKVKSLSTEARQKLTLIKPVTISQASRISGVSPSDVSVLLVYMGR